MTVHHRFTPGPVHILKLPVSADIVMEITAFAADNGIGSAWVTYLGAVRRASLRYYDQDAKKYRDFVIDEHLEVLSGVGNISLLDGKPFLHTHAAFGDGDGKAFGGHLNEGCEAFLIEVRIEELEGDALVREFDEETGLAPWV
jgi:hypothetical protein